MKFDDATGYFLPDFYESGPESYLRRSAVIEVALTHTAQRRTVIQAGGHIGIWPRTLAEHFARVVSFEPVASNWECLCENAALPNVSLHRAALGATNGTVHLAVRATSSGGHHVATRLNQPYVPVPMRALDTLGLTDVDALFLDIEGFEIEALKGATRILTQRPLLVIENNGCSRKYGYERDALGHFLAPYGYRYVERFDEDDIFVYCPSSSDGGAPDS